MDWIMNNFVEFMLIGALVNQCLALFGTILLSIFEDRQRTELLDLFHKINNKK